MAFSVSMGYGDRMTWRLALNKTPRHFKPLHHQTLSDGLRGERATVTTDAVERVQTL